MRFPSDEDEGAAPARLDDIPRRAARVRPEAELELGLQLLELPVEELDWPGERRRKRRQHAAVLWVSNN